MGSRMTEEEKREILELYNSGSTIKEIAELTEKKYDTIWHMIRRSTPPKEPTQKKVSKEEKNTTFDARRSSPTTEDNTKPRNLHINRGEIYYISKTKGVLPQQQEAGRPAIIISNNKCNQYSDRVEVVYLTTQEKNKDLPTHATLYSTGKKSIALCENIYTIYKDQIEGYCGKCTDEEMAAVNVALVNSIGLKFSDVPVITEEEHYNNQPETEVNIEHQAQTENTTNQNLIFEKDVYKKLYEDLFERVLSR